MPEQKTLLIMALRWELSLDGCIPIVGSRPRKTNCRAWWYRWHPAAAAYLTPRRWSCGTKRSWPLPVLCRATTKPKTWQRK
nr:MAG TPA: hypothetical protein [Caudoviricetes sp.]